MTNARDWLSERFAGDLALGNDGENGAPQLAIKNEDDADGALARINQELQLADPVSDLSDEAQETRLVMAARMQMARSRQQMLSSMVMLGINRICLLYTSRCV